MQNNVNLYIVLKGKKMEQNTDMTTTMMMMMLSISENGDIFIYGKYAYNDISTVEKMKKLIPLMNKKTELVSDECQ